MPDMRDLDRAHELIKRRYPGKEIVTGPGMGELIVPVAPGMVVAFIWESLPHWHEILKERYEIIHGKLALHHGGHVVILESTRRRPLDDKLVPANPIEDDRVMTLAGLHHTVSPLRHHWAESMTYTSSRQMPVEVLVTSTPAWCEEDHNLIWGSR